MANKKECDRCKQIYNPSQFRTKYELWLNKGAGDTTSFEALDLCTNCVDQLKAWFNNPIYRAS